MKFNEIKDKLIDRLFNIPYEGDIGDIGNEIGIVIGELTKEEISEFKHGINHGISLTDGTH